ncbi:hypothetical protein QZH41_017640 [Actinostola sp. cb2023]|nr:hypothetical protein QZH41_017640 [Actinostola sp. cb2023]
MSSEENEVSVRPPEVVTVSIIRCKNLKGSKGDAINSLVRAEFGSVSLGESSKVEANTETSTTDYNFNATFECSFDDPTSLDSIAHKPVIVTIIEVLPKDKKGKEEKTNVLGQGCIDLIPLLQGECSFSVIQAIHSLTPPTDATVEHVLPEIEITVSVSQPLLNESQLQASNLLSVHVDSAYSIPEAMQPAQPFLYTVSLPIPLTAQKENTVVLANGILRTAGEKEPLNQRKWCSAPSASGTCLYIRDSPVHEEITADEEDGDLRDKEDQLFRSEAMHEKNRITWNAERRCFISSDAAESFQSKIAQNRVWPVEIVRTPFPQATKSKGKQTAAEEEVPISYHGVAYVNMAPLLYPGVNRIHGAYLVRPFLENEVIERTKRKGNLSEEAARIASGMSRTLVSAMAQKVPPPSKQGKTDAKAKPSGAGLKPDVGSEIDSSEVKNVEGQQYLESKTFITLEIVLSKPLVPKRPPSSLARKVAECIPPRPVFARKTGGAKKAVEDYHSQVTNVANSLLEEFRYIALIESKGELKCYKSPIKSFCAQMFGEQLMDSDIQVSNEAMDHRRRKFLYELNTSGKYFAFKEQMKLSVIKLVREKYLKTSAFTDKEELHAFLSELYIFLVDQMHQALSKFIAADDTPEEPPPITDSAMLKHFAREAEVNQNYELAAKYYQERLARSKNDAGHWFDYGAFCLLIGDIAKVRFVVNGRMGGKNGIILSNPLLSQAEECFKETIALNQKHVSGLLMYGCVCLMLERYEVAETFFEAATCVEPNNVVAWTMLGLYYDSIQNDIGAERAFLEANRFNVNHPINRPSSVEQTPNDPSTEQVNDGTAEGEGGGGGDIPVVQVESVFMEDVPDTEQPTQEDIPPSNVGPPLPSSVSDMQGKQVAKPATQSSVNASKPASPPVSNAGSATVLQDEPSLIVAHEEITPKDTKPVVGIFLQTAAFLLEVNALQLTESALAHELVACNGQPSADYCVMLGRLKIQQLLYEDAEDKLKQAIVLNHQFQQAKDTFLKACARSPSCVSWLGVGKSCYRLGELMDAEDALSEANILNNKDSEVWGYLSLVCLNTARQLEAEQAYKYALKLKLKDENLLNEIHRVQGRVGFGNPIVA